MRSF
jgi:hypothetical protein